MMSAFGSSGWREMHTLARDDRTSFLSPYTEHWDWGRVDLPDPVRATRSGIARYGLSVYAPGTNDAERRDLAVAKRWWFGSALGTTAAELLVGAANLGGATASIVGFAGLAVAWYWLARTRTIRRGTRAIRIAVVMVGPREIIGNSALFDECRRALIGMDDATRSGASSPLEREAVWSAVYERLAPAGGSSAQTGD